MWGVFSVRNIRIHFHGNTLQQVMAKGKLVKFDGVEGRSKSFLRQKVMSKDEDRIIVQCSKDFVDAAMQVLDKTEVFFRKMKVGFSY